MYFNTRKQILYWPKTFWSYKITQKNGKKRKSRVESDWKEYTGSNSTLLEDINNGVEFKKEIMVFSKTKAELSFLETYAIMKSGALTRPDFYNNWVSCKITRMHLNKIKDELEEKIKIIDSYLPRISV